MGCSRWFFRIIILAALFFMLGRFVPFGEKTFFQHADTVWDSNAMNEFKNAWPVFLDDISSMEGLGNLWNKITKVSPVELPNIDALSDF